MTAIRTIIVDDESLARARLRRILGRERDIDIVAECADGNDAIAKVRALRPDLLWLDVEMPECDGFGVIRAIADECSPVVVFVTAFSEFAVQAFEERALDYVLKPFGADRIREALARARDQLSRPNRDSLRAQVAELMREMSLERAAPVARIPVRSGARVRFVRLADIDYVTAAGNYAEIHTGGASHLLRETMAKLEGVLDPRQFVRIHRSAIVNIHRIEEIEAQAQGTYRVVLAGGVELRSGRSYRDRLLAALAL